MIRQEESLTEWTKQDERRDLRRLVGRLLSEDEEGAITDRELRWALSRSWAGDTDDVDELAESIAYHVSELRSARESAHQPVLPTDMTRSDGGRESPRSPEGPSWWGTETERHFERLRPLQERILTLLDMTDDEGHPTPLPVDEISVRLRAIAGKEKPGGDAWSLPVPTYRDEEHGWFHLQELIVWRGPNGPWEEQRLWRLAQAAEHVTKKTGCSEEDALVFLLCDEVPFVPWVQTHWDAVNGVIELKVRNPRVSPSDVATAYRSLRDAFFGKKRRGGEWPIVAKDFVDRLKERSEWTDWSRAFELFKEKHSDQPYASVQSFQQAVYSREKRERQAKADK